MIKDGDVRAALSYLEGKHASDPLLYSFLLTTLDGRFKHLFWVDGCS